MSETLSEIFSRIIDAAKGTSWLEWAGIVTALLYVVLAAKENKWCWPFGIISSGIYIFFNARLNLYFDASLSFYYCIVGIYGWYAWTRGKKERGEVRLHRSSYKELSLPIAAGAGASLLFGFLAAKYTGWALPYFDATLTAFSLVATWLTARKALENWLLWILVDGAYVVLYLMRDAPMTAALFLIYTIIAAYGYFVWRKRLQTSNA